MEQEDLIALFQRQEPLCDELLAFYSNNGRFFVVQHPLVYSVPHSNHMNALLNFQYKMRQGGVLKKKIKKADVFAYPNSRGEQEIILLQ